MLRSPGQTRAFSSINKHYLFRDDGEGDLQGPVKLNKQSYNLPSRFKCEIECCPGKVSFIQKSPLGIMANEDQEAQVRWNGQIIETDPLNLVPRGFLYCLIGTVGVPK